MMSKLLNIYIKLISTIYLTGINAQVELIGKGECGSFSSVSSIYFGIGDRIRDVSPQLVENGGTASLHNSATDLGTSTHRCGAILISRHYLLTAAHCMVRTGTERIKTVSLGRSNLDENPSPSLDTYKIKKFYIHPSYGSGTHKYHDIAIIETEGQIIYSRHIWPLCLPQSNEIFKDKFLVDISGWGQVDQSLVSSSIMNIASTEIVENSRCKSLWQRYAPQQYEFGIVKLDYPAGLNGSIMCAGKLGVDACSGDSGGPMYYKTRNSLTAIGIIARGISTCPIEPVVPGFYTDIRAYIGWIYDITRLSRPSNLSILGSCLPPFKKLPETNECFYVSKRELSWDDARYVCKVLGGDLAVPRDVNVVRKHLSTIPKDGPEIWSNWYYVGGNDRASPRTKHSWINGKAVTGPWYINNPDLDQEENCLLINHATGELADSLTGCASTWNKAWTTGYICQK